MDPFCFLCFMFVMLSYLFLAALYLVNCCERAGLGSFVCEVFLCFCHYPKCCPGSSLVFDCINSWSLPSSLL